MSLPPLTVRVSNRCVTAAAAGVLLFGCNVAAATGAEFVAAFRELPVSYLLTATGEIYGVRPGDSVPTSVFVLSDTAARRPFRWNSAVRSFVRWRSEWVVADGSKRLLHFDAGGAFSGSVEAPFRVGKLAVAGKRLFALNVLANNAGEQVWQSTDGKHFSPLKRNGENRRFESPLDNLILLGGGHGDELYVASLIGPPVLHRIWPPDRLQDLRLAYSRSTLRAGLEEATGFIDDVTPYSQPIRDLVVSEQGDVLVLRNREDVRTPSGRLELISGQRADRYDASGRHMATAVFPRTMNWITLVTPASVWGMSKSGDIATAKWGKPIAGEILKP